MENEQMTERKYYTLCERTPGGLWHPQFGDYNKQVVIQERRDMKDSQLFIKGTEFTIIATSSTQKMINEAIAQLNEEALNKALRVADEK
jgi:prophage DNA circulation protein